MSRREYHPVLIGTGLLTALVAVFVASSGVPAMGVAADTPTPGLHAYTMGHAMSQRPPDRVGGPLTVNITQQGGSTRLVLPGPRFLDPSVFGSPDNPVGFDAAPFPLLGVPTGKRETLGGEYSIVDQATPFSDWHEVGVGDVRMKVVDATAIDGARTKDQVDFEANFELPDGSKYRVTCNKLLSHGMAYPFFGGVVTNHLLHGATGIGSRLMPTEFSYAAFWGIGNIYKDGELINENHMIHAMATEIVRGEGYKLGFDGGVGNPSEGVTLHLMIPPYKPTPQGMQPAPLKTMFMPFPYIQKHMQAAMQEVNQLPASERSAALARFNQVKELMEHTKEHVMQATQEGTMFGMPFIHIMFGNVKMTTG